MKYLLLACILLLPACNSLPNTITVVEKEFQKIDPVFTDVTPIPQPEDGTVGARTISHDERGALLELWSCHRLLLARLSAGEKIDEKECDN